MASTYSTNLALELIGTGDQAGTWGNTTNTNLGTLIEQAISGYVTQAVATGTDTTLTIPNGATGVARNMYIELTGTGGTNTNLIVPSNKKLYFIFNNASGAVTVKVSGQTGVSVPAGEKKILVSNGTDIVEATSYLTSVGTSLNLTTLTATSANITTLTSASATITNLLGTTLTISGNSFLATSSGNVGIGTTSPATNLSVVGTGITDASSNGAYQVTVDNNAAYNLTPQGGIIHRFKWSSAGTLTTGAGIRFYKPNTNDSDASSQIGFLVRSGIAAQSQAMTLDSSGNLGIGTASPGVKLTVSDASTGALIRVASDTNGSNRGFQWFNNGNSALFGSILSNYTTGILTYDSGGAAYAGFHAWSLGTSGEAMRLNTTGLGIGTTSPASLFHMAKGGGYAWQYMDSYGAGYYGILDSRCSRNSTVGSFTATNSGDTLLLIRANGTNSGATAFAQGASIEILQSGAAGATYVPAAIKFNTSDGTNAVAERARVTSTGNLLVGTTTDVSGRSGVISDISGNVRAIPRTGSAKTAVYTLTVSDVGQFVELGTGGGIDVPNGVFSTGDVVSVFNNTTGNRTISLTITTAYIGGTDSDKASVTLATRGVATVLFISNSVCVVNGNVS